MKISGQLIKRISVYLIGIYFTAVAIAISKMTPLGISPNSSLPNEISLILDANLGLMTAIVFASFVIIQWILLGKNFRVINFIQVILSIIYGFFVNSAVALVNRVLPPCDTYIMQLVYTLMALPAEGLVQAVAQRFKIPFPNAKNICDITIVTISVILSFAYFGTLYGIREGTIIHAVLVGRSVKWSDKLFGRQLERFIWGNGKDDETEEEKEIEAIEEGIEKAI